MYLFQWLTDSNDRLNPMIGWFQWLNDSNERPNRLSSTIGGNREINNHTQRHKCQI